MCSVLLWDVCLGWFDGLVGFRGLRREVCSICCGRIGLPLCGDVGVCLTFITFTESLGSRV